jgi:S-adenosylmethionine hydrolase
MHPVITLLTDFGTRDHYVAAMKGVILSMLPEAVLVDISHDVEPQDVAGAAWLLDGCWQEYPQGTVHLVVVDPGVGSRRKAIAVASAGRILVGPDNGLFTFALDEEGASAREIAAPEIVKPDPNPVFHGRDIFAPTAAALAGGFAFERIGPPLPHPVRLEQPAPEVNSGKVSGEVISIDRFGNLVTNVSPAHLGRAGIDPDEMVVEIAGRLVSNFVVYYDAAPSGEAVVLTGSRGLLELACKNGDAARTLGAARGDKLTITPSR